MADNNSTSKVDTNILTKGLVTDLNESFMGKEIWSHARNAVLNSQNGQVQFIQNEQSNEYCLSLPYTPIGFVRVTNNRWIVFLTNNQDSEIGIIDEHLCSYTKVVNDKCLNFSTKSLVDAKFRLSKTETVVIYWTDKGRNPRRFLDISNIPYKYIVQDDACATKEYGTDLDCDKLLVDKNIDVPTISVNLGINGTLKNGTYSFAIAYTDEKERVTDYYGLTLPEKIFSHSNRGASIELNISNLDRDFDEYELVCVYSINEAVFQKRLGYYNISTTNITVSSVERPEQTTISLDELIIPRAKYPYADFIESNNQYLLWAGLRTYQELNYQKQAMNIIPHYIVYQLPVEYYKNGGQLAGYMRDEIYAFGIQWLYKNGQWSTVYHIPGIKSKPSDIQLAVGEDAFEAKEKTTTKKMRKFEIENTASAPRNVKGLSDKHIIAKGDMAYWESTELYPDNHELFPDDACTPIRHHKFPDDCKVPRYTANGTLINLLSVEFTNIEHPKDYNDQYDTNIVGYRIVRGDRTGNQSIVSKGFFSNVRYYTEENNTEVKYSNYPVNDLRPDSFLSTKAVINKKNSEKNYAPLSGVKDTEFNYYSPETLFNRVQLGTEVNIYTEENATVEGFFEKVYNHPKAKLLTEFDLYFALIIGALDGYYATKGKKCVTKVGKHDFNIGITAGSLIAGNNNVTVSNPSSSINGYTQEQACDDALAFTSASSVNTANLNVAEKILRTLAQVGVFAYFAIQTAQKVLEIILNASPWEQYALQHNSYAKFTNSTCTNRGYKRRRIDYYQYISDGLNTVQESVFNNYKKEESVFIKLNDTLEDFNVLDNTRITLSEAGLCGNLNGKTSTNASVYYGAIKRKIPNQYGSIDSVSYIDTTCFTENLVPDKNGDKFYVSSPVFGGDTYITSFTVRKSQHMFSTFLKGNELGQQYPDGYIFDYSRYRNVGYPRFWINTEPYDVSNIVSLNPNRSRTPQNKHNLDCQGNVSFDNITIVKDRYFYTSVNSVIDMLVESTYNLDYRDYKGSHQNFYSSANSNLSLLFRSDRIEEREEFVYDKTYFKQLVENFMYQQSIFFKEEKALVESYVKNKVIYSARNKWLIYLAANFTIFPIEQFGNLTALKAIDNEKIMFLFDKSAPYITPGRDELQLDGSGRTITLGTGGIFSRPLIPIAYTDYYYANSESSRAFLNTQFGSFFISQRQGRIFQYTGQLEEISINGMNWWFKNYLPSYISEAYPDFKHKDNPVEGVGLTMAFDNTNEVIYFTKRDYKPLFKDIVYNAEIDQFLLNSKVISLHDTSYFEDASWTISYNPKLKTFVSWHDWHPEWILQNEKHFSTTKNSELWKHNKRCGSFCNFYGTDYPFEVEIVDNNGQTVTVLRSVEYFLEAGKYYNSCTDFHMLLDENFDYGIVSNNEQSSGLLKFNLQDKKRMDHLAGFPYYDSVNQCNQILFNKEEQKYRFNQFDDLVRDRGEFTGNSYPIWITESNGYVKNLNQIAHNYTKAVQHRKKIRNVWTKVKLIKSISKNKKLMLKFVNTKQVQSSR